MCCRGSWVVGPHVQPGGSVPSTGAGSLCQPQVSPGSWDIAQTQCPEERGPAPSPILIVSEGRGGRVMSVTVNTGVSGDLGPEVSCAGR